MKILYYIISLMLLSVSPGFGSGMEQNPDSGSIHTQDELGSVLNQVEERYGDVQFSARFVQTSTIKAMDISDTAKGRLCVKAPDMMRWEYETPTPQLVLTNGRELWVYRPEDNQVMVGKSPVFFEGGKGAGFLSDIKLLRSRFNISLESAEDQSVYLLKLIPLDDRLDISVLYLYVTKADASLSRIITLNSYGDETRIDLFDHEYNLELDDELFNFIIPRGTDVLHIDE